MNSVNRAFLEALRTSQQIDLVRQRYLKMLASPAAPGRRQLLIGLRQNERLHQEIFGRPHDDAAVHGYLEELERLLAATRGLKKGRTPDV